MLTREAEDVRLHGPGDIVGNGEEMAYRERVGDALRCEARNAGKIDRLLGMAKSSAGGALRKGLSPQKPLRKGLSLDFTLPP